MIGAFSYDSACAVIRVRLVFFNTVVYERSLVLPQIPNILWITVRFRTGLHAYGFCMGLYGFPGEERQTTVGLSTTAIFGAFAGYVFGN